MVLQRALGRVRVTLDDSLEDLTMAEVIDPIALRRSRHALPMRGQPGGECLVHCGKNRVLRNFVKHGMEADIGRVEARGIWDRTLVRLQGLAHRRDVVFAGMQSCVADQRSLEKYPKVIEVLDAAST